MKTDPLPFHRNSHEHVSERLSLNEVAAVFGISPNYLSQLFSKYNDTGFSEYINICKVTEAKRLLEEEKNVCYVCKGP